MTFNDDQLGRLGKLADKLDNILYSARLPLPPRVHIVALTGTIREVRDEIAGIVRSASGSDPWATNPLDG